jgi:aerobic-type carbon monoxide dehydrogenase small subunit (CoxS/CutS family)
VAVAIRLTVNGEQREVRTVPERPMLDVLREDLKLTGTKYGCGEGQCRVCTVLLDGKPVSSCLTPVGKAGGKTIVTIEGLAANGSLHPVQQAFLEKDAMQCGYCVPGMILTTVSLLEQNPHPSDEQIVEFLNGNLCRCCGYPNILSAVRQAVTTAGPSETAEVRHAATR